MVERAGSSRIWPAICATAVVALLGACIAVAGDTRKETEMTGKPGSTKPGAPPPATDVPEPSGPKPMVPDPTREDRDDYDVDDDEDDRGKPSVASPKRAAPPEVGPVTIDGTTYRQHFGPVEGIGQNSGLLAAWSPGADRPDWVIAVYPVTYRAGLERDVQEVYFASMARGDGPVLIVTNERGKRFAVDVTARKVMALE